jgi:hypothetical protein
MTLQNKLNNWLRDIKRVRTKGAVNTGTYYDRRSGYWVFCKYDWSKPCTFITEKYPFENWEHYKKRLGEK